ncbi:hypothetical protein L4174_023700 (plasmid) [Photobacterium sp. CCB-ST2H9]|uniref:hypothetical protein n=1 Tax=Photobacterium sp. CCB-ST2H9 TaxID=2912855 RepID=UPI0020052AD3|nr:hypothetical protein [Photobacterium sp. CCB-ST2H9]UTM60474.1 hypothetical protein L4174_023700 [Photobacterium sp. CCB-ST2H9]
MAGKEKLSSKIGSLMRQVFPSYREEDRYSPNITMGGNTTAQSWMNANGADIPSSSSLGSGGESNRDRLYIDKLPEERINRYAIYEEMADDSTIAAALDIHIGHALSTDSRTGRAMWLKPKSDASAEYVERLNYEVMEPINREILNWIRPTCILGANYVRPHGEPGRGIVAWESNHYTLPSNIKEYEKGGQTVGFTSKNFISKIGTPELAPPWALIPLKLPNWVPSTKKEPSRLSGKEFNLYDDAYRRDPVETQNYGMSLLHTSHDSWCSIRRSLRSLGASRNNASHIDRFVTVSTDGLDIARASEYMHLVASQLKQDKEESLRLGFKRGFISTVWNSVIPVMGGSKGGVSIDTQTISPDIQHIEDIMFDLKRLAGTLGVDPSMLGFSDLLSGGLGDGGFLRTSIQSALRANLLRSAAASFVLRSIDIHTAFRDQKVWLPQDRPFELEFNSMNTAIALEESAARESRANYASIVVTLLEQIESGTLSKSITFKNKMYNSLLDCDAEEVELIISELASNVAGNDQLLESLGADRFRNNQRAIRDEILNVLYELNVEG